MKAKVLFITCKGKGGSNVSLRNTLFQIKHKVDICLIVPDRETYDFFKDIECKRIIYFKFHIYPQCCSLKEKLFWLPKVILHYIVNKIAVRKIMRLYDKKIQLIHTNSSIIDIGDRIARKIGVPHVWHLREYIDKDFNFIPIPSMAKYKERLQDNNTITITHNIEQHFSLNARNRVIYNGILSKVKHLPIKIDNNYFLYVGSITADKGFSELCDAYEDYISKASEPRKLLVAGSPASQQYMTNIKNRICQSKLYNYIEFLGQLDLPSTEAYMRNASALIVPSLYEAFGRITAEAMSNGCIVIGKNTGGTREQFDNGLEITGREIGYRYSTIEELSIVLQKFSTIKESEIELMRQDAFKTVQTLYSNESNAENILTYYTELIASV